MPYNIALRNPQKTESSQAAGYVAPSPEWLEGTWYVTQSTLPMWKERRNVKITYTTLPNGAKQKMGDTVSYENFESDEVKKVKGVDTACGAGTEAWNWRGKGLLSIATCRWEILGHGDCKEECEASVSPRSRKSAPLSPQWAVTYFAKTLFTPAGIDIYSRTPLGLPTEILKDIKTALISLEDPDIKRLSGELYVVKQQMR